VEVKVVAGSFDGVSGPVADVVTSPEYLDVFVPPEGSFTLETRRGDTVFIYVHQGDCALDGDGDGTVIAKNRDVALYGDGDGVRVRAGAEGARFLLVSGTPLGEPIAWGGPIVMNTRDELTLAFEELEQGTFIKRERGAEQS